VLTPLAGYPLAVAIGANLDEYWIELSEAIYAAVAVVWLAGLLAERRIRRITQEAAINGKPLPDSYRRLFRIWCATAIGGLAGMIAIMVLMIRQPHWA